MKSSKMGKFVDTKLFEQQPIPKIVKKKYIQITFKHIQKQEHKSTRSDGCKFKSLGLITVNGSSNLSGARLCAKLITTRTVYLM